MEADLEVELAYTENLLTVIKEDVDNCTISTIKKLYTELQTLQAYLTAFTVNIKRIVRILPQFEG